MPCISNVVATEASTVLNLLAQYQNSDSHLLSIYVFYRSGGDKLLKYQLDSSRVIISLILVTVRLYKAGEV